MRKKLIRLVVILSIVFFGARVYSVSGSTSCGSLESINQDGEKIGSCPLQHTDVKAEISGFLSGVTVTQEFQNPFKERTEAIYTFPLPQNAAVDDMTMYIGKRVVRGVIMRREEAYSFPNPCRQLRKI